MPICNGCSFQVSNTGIGCSESAIVSTLGGLIGLTGVYIEDIDLQEE
jgi:hypothetical protein